LAHLTSDVRSSDRSSRLRARPSSEEGERSAEVDCERYTDREDYMGRFTKALDELVAARWVLAEDRAAMLQLGEREWAEATK